MSSKDSSDEDSQPESSTITNPTPELDATSNETAKAPANINRLCVTEDIMATPNDFDMFDRLQKKLKTIKTTPSTELLRSKDIDSLFFAPSLSATNPQSSPGKDELFVELEDKRTLSDIRQRLRHSAQRANLERRRDELLNQVEALRIPDNQQFLPSNRLKKVEVVTQTASKPKTPMAPTARPVSHRRVISENVPELSSYTDLFLSKADAIEVSSGEEEDLVPTAPVEAVVVEPIPKKEFTELEIEKAMHKIARRKKRAAKKSLSQPTEDYSKFIDEEVEESEDSEDSHESEGDLPDEEIDAAEVECSLREEALAMLESKALAKQVKADLAELDDEAAEVYRSKIERIHRREQKFAEKRPAPSPKPLNDPLSRVSSSSFISNKNLTFKRTRLTRDLDD